MPERESVNCTDSQITQTSTPTSSRLGSDQSVAGTSGDIVSVPVVVKMDPDVPRNDVNIQITISGHSNRSETLLKTEPSDNTDNTDTEVIKIEPACSSQERVNGDGTDGNLQPLTKSACGIPTSTAVSNSFTSGISQHCSQGSVFSTPHMTTAATGGFTIMNQHYSTGLVFSTPQITTAPSTSFTFRTNQNRSGLSNFGMTTTESNIFGTPLTSTTGSSGFMVSVPLSGDAVRSEFNPFSGKLNTRTSENPFFRSSSAVRVQNQSVPGKTQTATAPCCSCFSFFRSPKCSHHLSRSTPLVPLSYGGFPFGSAPQRQQTEPTLVSNQLLSTLPGAAVTTAAESSLSPCVGACLDCMELHVWDKHLFRTTTNSTTLQPVPSTSGRAYTGASSPQTVCSTVSTPQTKFCFGMSRLKVPNVTTHIDDHQQSTTTGSQLCSTTTVSHSEPCPRSCFVTRRKRKNQCGCEYREQAKYRCELSDKTNMRDNLEEQPAYINATVVSRETGEDRTLYSERPLNLTASDLKIVVIPVDYPNVRLSEDDFIELQLALIEEMFCSKDGLLPQFSACYFESGTLVLKCKTDDSKDWLRGVLPNLKSWKGVNLKVGDYKDYLFSTRVSLGIPPAMAMRSPNSILCLIKKQNEDLDTDQWKFLNSVEQDRGQILHLSLDPPAIQDLKNRGCNIFVGLEQIMVKICNK